MKRFLFTVICVILIGIILYSGYMLYQEWEKAKITHEAIAELDPYVPQVPKEGASPDPQTIEKLRQLQAQNADVCGWIIVTDTNINYPLVQAEDNSYYLKRSPLKKYLSAGSIFLDCRNNNDFTDFETIIYGHYMNSGTMFANIQKFKNSSYFEEHRDGWIITLDAVYRLELYAYLNVPSSDKVYTVAYETIEDQQAQLDYIKQKAKLYREIGVTAEDRIVALSTCSYEYDGARAVVIAKLVPNT